MTIKSRLVNLRQKSLKYYPKEIMFLSKSCMYGIRALLYLTLERERKFVSIKEISERLNISFHFLTKILQELSRENILLSFKGPKGGVALAKHPLEITLLDIINIIDGPAIFEECILGLPDCKGGKACPLHCQWTSERERLKTEFQNSDLESVSKKIIENDLRLY